MSHRHILRSSRGGAFRGWPFGRPASLTRSPGSFIFDVADRQPQQFHYRVVVGEMATVLDDLAQLIVQRFAGIGGVEDLADLRREFQKRNAPLPGVPPHPHRGLMLLAQRRALENVQLLAGGAGGGGVDGPQRRGHSLTAVMRDEPHRSPNQMHHTDSRCQPPGDRRCWFGMPQCGGVLADVKAEP